MRIGVRWLVGTPPNSGVPTALHTAIAECEAEFPAAIAWTLTWLESVPYAALDDCVTVTLDAAGSAVLRRQGDAAPAAAAVAAEEDDDRWLFE